MLDRITVRVPATTANIGPGFDCMAIALDIWNYVTVELGKDGFEIYGEGAESLSQGSSNLVAYSFRTSFEESGREPPNSRFVCNNGIPLSRGLGSSSAAVVSGLVAGNELSGNHLAQNDLLKLATEIEGHSDNVSAALLGGCQVVVMDDAELITSKVPIPNCLKAVVFIPNTPMPTEEARNVLTPTIDRTNAVFNVGRVALLINAFATGDLTNLTVATQDRLHQPDRSSIFPSMKVIIQAALNAGAHGAFLSGAGSSILALTTEREITIGYEMAEAASKAGVEGIFKVVQLSEKGAHIGDDNMNVTVVKQN